MYHAPCRYGGFLIHRLLLVNMYLKFFLVVCCLLMVCAQSAYLCCLSDMSSFLKLAKEFPYFSHIQVYVCTHMVYVPVCL